MSPDTRITPTGIDERMLFIHQSLKYAEDLVRLYEETEAMRKELHRIKVRLAAEITARRRIERELRGRAACA